MSEKNWFDPQIKSIAVERTPSEQNYWLDEAVDIHPNAWEYVRGYAKHELQHAYREYYMQQPVPNPWDNAGEELARMIADGCSRSHIRKAFLNYYPSMTNTDVNRMLQQYEEQHGPLF